MSTKEVEYVTKEMLHEYIAQAAQTAGYEKGFGITGCDLSMPVWWAGYCRQSLDQQSHNNRLPEYILTLAKMAKDQGVVIPLEYVFYDHVTGEHLDRPGMQILRNELMERKKILGILFSDLRCLSREPAPQQVFERECEIRGVKLMFGDAPSGMDIGSQFARSAITFSNKLTRLATHSNARAGNVGRVLKGSVPSGKAAYGYDYQRDAEIASDGKVRIKKAWWVIDGADAEGVLIENSPAWVVTQVFHWIGLESRTSWWVAKKLNEMGIRSAGGGLWGPNTVCKLVRRCCYTGKNAYNSKSMVPNPARPLGDVTGQIKRTILRPKPQGEWVFYNVPQLVSEELWQKANAALTLRGRGRGKEGKVIQALLRSRIFCPRCGLPMVVRRDGDNKKVFYHCAKRYRTWDAKACGYRKFISGSWDDYIWDCIYALLSDDSWIENQMVAEQHHQETSTKLVDSELRKIVQLHAKITKVQTGYEEGVYNTEEAKSRIKGCQKAIAETEAEISKMRRKADAPEMGTPSIETLKHQLESLRHMNLESASFDDKLRMMGLIDIKVYPSEDLKTVRIKSKLGLASGAVSGDDEHCGKVLFAPPKRIRTDNQYLLNNCLQLR